MILMKSQHGIVGGWIMSYKIEDGIIYKGILDKRGLFSLQHWKLRGDLIEMYKVVSWGT